MNPSMTIETMTLTRTTGTAATEPPGGRFGTERICLQKLRLAGPVTGAMDSARYACGHSARQLLWIVLEQPCMKVNLGVFQYQSVCTTEVAITGI